MKTLLFFISLFFLQVNSLHSNSKRYELVDLGLQKYSYSKATSINESGHTCGYYIDGSYTYVFVSDPDKKLATRCEDFYSDEFLINKYNEVFGSFTRVHEENYYNFYYIITDEFVYKWMNPFNYFQYFNFKYLCGQYSGFGNFRSSVVWDVNDLGQVLVMDKLTLEDDETSLKETSVWLYDKDTLHKIVDSRLEVGVRINNQSQILGCFYTGSVLYKNRISYTSIYNFNDKTCQVLDLPGSSLGADINELGQVAGNFYNPSEGMIMGYLYEPTGEIAYIENFLPVAMNNQSQLIGEFLYAEKKGKPALYDHGVVYDISDLVNLVDDNGTIWDSVDYLTDINDQGWIIGNGTVKGQSHSFVLKPLSRL